jgi:hypothetical protein
MGDSNYAKMFGLEVVSFVMVRIYFGGWGVDRKNRE